MTIAATCNQVPDSRTTRGGAWLAIAIVDNVTYSATSRSSAVGALCRELVAGGVPDDAMAVTFDGVAGQMTTRSIHRFAGTTTTEGDVPVHRVKWQPYHGPQNAQRAAMGGQGASQEPPAVIPGPADRDAFLQAFPLSVTDQVCASCGESFTPQRSTARFCSTRCRMAAHRRLAA